MGTKPKGKNRRICACMFDITQNKFVKFEQKGDKGMVSANDACCECRGGETFVVMDMEEVWREATKNSMMWTLGGKGQSCTAACENIFNDKSQSRCTPAETNKLNNPQ